ncbi:MAG: MFS transporter, partial [Pseudomonadota bacterium]
AAQATSLPELAALRFAQGIAASAPAVYAPVLVKQLYSAEGAVVMLGRLGSVEAMAPAVAPIIGAWLLTRYGWTASFVLVAVVAALIGLGWLVGPGLRAAFGRSRRVDAGYATLLADARFLRYGLSQACTLGALLVIVFAAPSVITVSLGGTLSDFIVMQVLGITLFVTAANLAGVFSRWWGVDRTLVVGSGVSALGCAGLVLKASAGLTAVPVLWGLFMLVNVGLGIRGPAGFFQALQAAGDNDARGSALVILFVMLITGAGTALVAPVIEHGLLPVALVAAGISSVSVLLVLNLRSAPAG